MANKNKLKKNTRATTRKTDGPPTTTGMGMDPRTGKMLKKHDMSNVRGRKKPA